MCVCTCALLAPEQSEESERELVTQCEQEEENRIVGCRAQGRRERRTSPDLDQV